MDFFPCPISLSNVRNETLDSLFNNYTALEWPKTSVSDWFPHQKGNTKNTKDPAQITRSGRHDGHYDFLSWRT